MDIIAKICINITGRLWKGIKRNALDGKHINSMEPWQRLINETSFCGFSVVHMRTWKEVARHVTGGNYKPQELRGNGTLAQLGNWIREGKTKWRILATQKLWDVMAIKGKVRPLTCHEGKEGNTGTALLFL